MSDFDMAAFMSGNQADASLSRRPDDDMNRSTSSVSSISRLFPKEDFKDDPELEFLSKGTKKTLGNALYVAERRATGGILLWQHLFIVLDTKLEELVDSEGAIYDPSVIPKEGIDLNGTCTVKECMRTVAKVLIKESATRQYGNSGHQGPDEEADEYDEPVMVEQNIFGRQLENAEVAALVVEQRNATQPITKKQVMLEDGSLHMQPQRTVLLGTIDYILYTLNADAFPTVEVLEADEGDVIEGEEVVLLYKWGDVVVPPLWRFAMIIILMTVAMIVAIVITFHFKYQVLAEREGERRGLSLTASTMATVDTLHDVSMAEFKEYSASTAKEIAQVLDAVAWDMTTEATDALESAQSASLLHLGMHHGAQSVSHIFGVLQDDMQFVSGVSELIASGDAGSSHVGGGLGWSNVLEYIASRKAEDNMNQRQWLWLQPNSATSSDILLLADNATLPRSQRSCVVGGGSDSSTHLTMNATCLAATAMSACITEYINGASPSTPFVPRCSVSSTGHSSLGAHCSVNLDTSGTFGFHATTTYYCIEDGRHLVEALMIPEAVQLLDAVDTTNTTSTLQVLSSTYCSTSVVESHSRLAAGASNWTDSVTFTNTNSTIIASAAVKQAIETILGGPSPSDETTTRSFTAGNGQFAGQVTHHNLNIRILLDALKLPPTHHIAHMINDIAEVYDKTAKHRLGLVRVCDVRQQREQLIDDLIFNSKVSVTSTKPSWSTNGNFASAVEGVTSVTLEEGNQTETVVTVNSLTAAVVSVVKFADAKNRTLHVTQSKHDGGKGLVIPSRHIPHLLQAAHGRGGSTSQSFSLHGEPVIAGYSWSPYARRGVSVEVGMDSIDMTMTSILCQWLKDIKEQFQIHTSSAVLRNSAAYTSLCMNITETTETIPSGANHKLAMATASTGNAFKMFVTQSSSGDDDDTHLLETRRIDWLGAALAVSYPVYEVFEKFDANSQHGVGVGVFALILIVVGLVVLSRLTLRDIAQEYEVYKREIDDEKESFIELVRDTVPLHIFRRVEQGERFFIESADHVSLCMTDVCNMTELWTTSDPMLTVRTLGYVFMVADGLANFYGIFKVNTIGDCYFCQGGLPETHIARGSRWRDTDETHVYRITSFACVMQQLMSGAYDHYPEDTYSFESFAEAHRLPQHEKLKLPMLRIGIHYGSVKQGVVDTAEAPTFDCYGEAVSMTKAMEMTCAPGRIQLSSSARMALRDQDRNRVVDFESSTKKLLRGFGTLPTYTIKSTKVVIPEEIIDWLSCVPTVRHRLHNSDGLKDVSAKEIAKGGTDTGVHHGRHHHHLGGGGGGGDTENTFSDTESVAAPSAVGSESEASCSDIGSETNDVKPFGR